MKNDFQLKITLDRGLPEAEDGQQRALLFQSYSALTDLVLEGYQDQLTSLSQNEELESRMLEVKASYVNCRNEVIARLGRYPDSTFGCFCDEMNVNRTNDNGLVSLATHSQSRLDSFQTVKTLCCVVHSEHLH